MNASQVIELIKSLEPQEIEKLFVWMKEYEAEACRRQAHARYASEEEFDASVDKVLVERKGLFQRLAEAERAEQLQNENH